MIIKNKFFTIITVLFFTQTYCVDQTNTRYKTNFAYFLYPSTAIYSWYTIKNLSESLKNHKINRLDRLIKNIKPPALAMGAGLTTLGLKYSYDYVSQKNFFKKFN